MDVRGLVPVTHNIHNYELNTPKARLMGNSDFRLRLHIMTLRIYLKATFTYTMSAIDQVEGNDANN